MTKWVRAGAVTVALLCSLSGCASSNPAFGLDAQAVVGKWEASGDFDTSLTLNADGSLNASGWPSNLHCVDSSASTTEDLSRSDPRDIVGTWSLRSGEFSYMISLLFGSESCDVGGTGADVWRAKDGTLAICLSIPTGIDPDSLTANQVFVLERPGSMAGPGTCR
jgi:hypothetical protein